MTDWNALAKARGFNIPEELVQNLAPALTALEESFRPLVAKLTASTEPAIVLSESAVLGE